VFQFIDDVTDEEVKELINFCDMNGSGSIDFDGCIFLLNNIVIYLTAICNLKSLVLEFVTMMEL
jgi:hypothetical protein